MSDDPRDPESFEPREARAFLQARGVPADEIEAAEREHRLHLLVFDRLLLPTEPRYTPLDVAELSGMPLELTKRLWRALGFPDTADDDVMFTDFDIDALMTVNGMIHMGFAAEDVAVQMARVIGSSMARIAEAEVQSAPNRQGELESKQLAELYALTAGGVVEGMARLLEYVWRRHLQAANRRAGLLRSSGGGAETSVAVGFADLVGFTALSQQVSEAALAEVVDRFEALAYDVVAREGGRVVKMIGDEVMFVVSDADRAVRIGVALAETYADDDRLSDVRVGIACGSQVLAREGDYYGPVVNRASRIVNIARPGSVVVDEDVRLAVEGDPELKLRALRPRYLKDIGRVALWSVARVETLLDDDDDAKGPSEGGTTRRRARRRRPIMGLLPEPVQERLEAVRGSLADGDADAE
jgi:adenylate cyclase